MQYDIIIGFARCSPSLATPPTSSIALLKDQGVDEDIMQQFEVTPKGQQETPGDTRPRIDDVSMKDVHEGHFVFCFLDSLSSNTVIDLVRLN